MLIDAEPAAPRGRQADDRELATLGHPVGGRAVDAQPRGDLVDGEQSASACRVGEDECSLWHIGDA
jgi:hypothetical protein